ncbi:MAG: helix-turn-helix transcriptional regulator [Lachnospiraceae bacterium]|nr:helix-turn-helix transcriptional regulator [Eubacterium sp.]MBQ9610362.1 helix-turn-helix transcriptional regulator [Lachnospiraceae bacterium]
MNRSKILNLAIDKLGIEFHSLDLTFHQMDGGKKGDVTSYWPGGENEDILICVFKGKSISEPFHRQDFFFINYAYKNDYQALSYKYDNLITIHEDECYIGQPYSGYALRGEGDSELVIIGVLIRKDTFFHEYLPTIYTDSDLFRFFIEPQTNKFSDEFIHLAPGKDHTIRSILEAMVMEYADRREDTQRLLKSMLQTLFLQIARRYRVENANTAPMSLSNQIMQYMEDHSDAVTLKDIAAHFSYHPNYISTLLHRETGRKFTDILLEKRMERAVLLLKNTTLSIEEITAMLGYSNNSNFYKAFRDYYGTTPREYK